MPPVSVPSHLKQRVEVPERALDEIVSGHFRKAHFQEDLPEFRPDFEQRMKIATRRHDAQGVEVVRLEGFRPPRTVLNHLRR